MSTSIVSPPRARQLPRPPRQLPLVLLTVGLALSLLPTSALAGTITGKVQYKGRPIKPEAVVYIDSLNKHFPPPSKPVVIDQVKMKFVPHVTPIVVGTTVRFLNSDSVQHNVFTPSKVADKFNLGTWPSGQSKNYTFKRPGEVVLLCKVHPEMEAYVVVLTNPFFSTTTRDGSFTITAVPPGTYTLKVWHEKRKPATQTVTVPASGNVQVNFNLRR